MSLTKTSAATSGRKKLKSQLPHRSQFPKMYCFAIRTIFRHELWKMSLKVGPDILQSLPFIYEDVRLSGSDAFTTTRKCQEHSGEGGVGSLQSAAGRTWGLNSAAELMCFSLQHIHIVPLWPTALKSPCLSILTSSSVSLLCINTPTCSQHFPVVCSHGLPWTLSRAFTRGLVRKVPEDVGSNRLETFAFSQTASCCSN